MKIIFIILLLLIPSLSLAVTPEEILDNVVKKEYWVYIQTVNKPAVNKRDIGGLAQKGDVIIVMPVIAGQEPTLNEQSKFLIVKSELTDLERYNLTKPVVEDVIKGGFVTKEQKVHRENKFDFDVVGVESKNGLIRDKKEIKTKKLTSNDLAQYEFERIKYAYFQRPFIQLANKIIPRAYAATNVSKICATGSNCTDEDYNSITAWEADKDGDLVTAGNIEVAELYKDDGEFNEDWTIFGSTTNSSNYMIIRSVAASRHTGKPYSSGTTYSGAATSQNSVFVVAATLADDYTRVEGLIINHDNYQDYAAMSLGNDATNNLVDKSIIMNTQTWGGEEAVYALSMWCSPCSVTITNSMFISETQNAMIRNHPDSTVVMYNVTAFNKGSNARGIINDTNGSYSAYNTTSFNFATTDLDVNTDGYYSATVTDFDFVDTTDGAWDLHLTVDSTNLIDAGSDTSASMTYDEDIDWLTRPSGSDWDIGAHEFVQAIAEVNPISIKVNSNLKNTARFKIQ